MIQHKGVKDWDKLQRRMRSLPEHIRRRNIHRILIREARPVVTLTRQIAYEGSSVRRKARNKTRDSQRGGSEFFNLYKTINVFKSRKNPDFKYVVIGNRATTKKPAGAYYANWQLYGGTAKGFKAKRYFDKAEARAMEQASHKAFRAVSKEVQKILETVFNDR